MTDESIPSADAQAALSRWWMAYDEGDFDTWPDLLAEDVGFRVRTDSGKTDWEEFIRADLSGRAEVLEWNTSHRMDSPYPLRHSCTNFVITESGDDEVAFASYLLVSQVDGVMPSPLPGGVCTGRIRRSGSGLVIADLELTLDMTASVTFRDRD